MKRIYFVLSTIFTILLVSLIYCDRAAAQAYYVNPNHTYSYSDMVKDINELKKAYPGLVKSKVIGKSEYGRNIYAISLGIGSSSVFINGSHHAREWMTTTVNMNMIDKYAFAYQHNFKFNGYDVKKILNNTTMWFVPMVNPDGVTLQQSGLKYFPKASHSSIIKMNNGSKNFKRWKANAKGIDLNRQYNAKWTGIKGPKAPSFKNYKGKAPHTAKEVKSLLSFVNGTAPEISISYHSSGQIIFWNYQQSGSRYTRDYTYAKTLGRMTGYSLVYPKSFASGGGFSDWFSRTKMKPAYTIEIAPFAGETHVPLSAFPKIWRQNNTIGLFVAQEGYKLYDKRQVAASQTLETKIKAYNKTADDLETYYYRNIKTASDLRINTNFKALYAKVNSEIKKNETAIAKLPTKYRPRPATALKPAKSYRDRSLAFMNGLNAGNNLNSNIAKLEQSFEAGTLNDQTISAYQGIVQSIPAVEGKINLMYGAGVRNLARAKYVAPAKDMAKNIGFEISRYQLIKQMQQELKDNKREEVTTDLEKLKSLNEQSAALKASSPEHYKTYEKIENILKQLQLEIEQNLQQSQPTGAQEDQNEAASANQQ
jgi:g-D-glutamyl-meso-diaminopimelate peptidase